MLNPDTLRVLDAAGVEHVGPRCGGAGELTRALTPRLDPRDPRADFEEFECPGCPDCEPGPTLAGEVVA